MEPQVLSSRQPGTLDGMPPPTLPPVSASTSTVSSRTPLRTSRSIIVGLIWLAKRSYIFSVTTPDPSVLSLEASDPTYLPEFVKLAQGNGTMASVSIGGWSGSGYFSSAVTPANRTTFVNAVLGLVSNYSLDGVDFE